MKTRQTTRISTAAVFLILAALPSVAAAKDKAKAAETAPAPAAPSSGSDMGAASERVNVESIKQKYWARGDESELGVVQNRLYSKDKKFELGLFGGFVTTDPFLTVNNYGATFGYHFNEYYSLALVGFRDLVSASSALQAVRNPYPVGLDSDYSTNEPRWFMGAEGQASIIYGKLSVIGKAIIHYDLHFLLGAGFTNTESGKYFTPHVGVGQQFFITKRMSLRLDYRLMRYSETILQKVGSVTSPNGTPIGNRANYTNSITMGVNFLFDPFGKKEAVPQGAQ